MEREREIIIVGCGSIGITSFAQSSIKDCIVEVVNNIESKNIVNQSFDSEPLIISNFRCEEFFDVKIKDLPRNKYFDKPRNNFKK